SISPAAPRLRDGSLRSHSNGLPVQTSDPRPRYTAWTFRLASRKPSRPEVIHLLYDLLQQGSRRVSLHRRLQASSSNRHRVRILIDQQIPTPEPLCDGSGCSATSKEIQDEVARIT